MLGDKPQKTMRQQKMPGNQLVGGLLFQLPRKQPWYHNHGKQRYSPPQDSIKSFYSLKVVNGRLCEYSLDMTQQHMGGQARVVTNRYCCSCNRTFALTHPEVQSEKLKANDTKLLSKPEMSEEIEETFRLLPCSANFFLVCLR